VANIKSQIKRNRQSEKRRVRNRTVRAEFRTRIKNALAAVEAGKATGTDAVEAMKMIDKAAARGIIHANTASRRKSRLQKRLNAAG
jgi:small subunit ribosomal protein S20